MKALVSIHDVMPHTLDRVERLLDWLKERNVPPVTLLVVPGRPWTKEQIGYLHEVVERGHPLAAHGWHHETKPRRLYHRIHAALISRNVAEHLAYDSKEILQLMQRSKNWFEEQQLPSPQFYVPPAWALGPISKADLAQVPYQLIETTRGLTQLKSPAKPAQSDREGSVENTSRSIVFHKLPLTGYEADTAFRECFLRRWNSGQAKSAQRRNQALRISIHPDDLQLRVADQMDQQIKQVEEFLAYNDFPVQR